eukprot:TRINITY_DN145_c0_g1_i1.p1 TRINITY_DN145_c0_g1~~TRINITY_DN145_c0_g1_i1.p1  ORF type:complete len:220 (-),score=52.31 TRINITY_DN145_c0_g1_i1:118-777(-)
MNGISLLKRQSIEFVRRLVDEAREFVQQQQQQERQREGERQRQREGEGVMVMEMEMEMEMETERDAEIGAEGRRLDGGDQGLRVLIARCVDVLGPIVDRRVRVHNAERFLRGIEHYGVSTDTETVIATIYMDRLVEIAPELLTPTATPVLYVACHLLAAKWSLDVPYDNPSYHQISAVPLHILNAVEVLLFEILRYNLPVSFDQFHAASNALLNLQPLE